MNDEAFHERRRIRQLDAAALVELQLGKLNALLSEVLPHNRFYGEKLAEIDLPLKSLDEVSQLPFTFKDELLRDPQGGDFAANRTFPIERYSRLHRTSGTRGRPLVVLDTPDDWRWWISTWQHVLDAASIGPEDRVLMAFSFGPFIGFWSANDALAARGSLVIPTGGLSTVSRLELAQHAGATAICCTPSYALHMAETAAANQIDAASLAVQTIIVAGEPGGSTPAVRDRIETVWNAQVIDHAGATEVGPWGVADANRRGVHVIESEFLAEFLSIESGQPATEGELSELVLTTLGRSGGPVIRYRTGDLVRPSWGADGDCNFVLLEGGVLGRADDMMIIRGVNVFPSAVEQILRSFPEVVEYRLTVHKRGQMDALTIEIEDRLNNPQRVAKELKIRLGLRVDVCEAEIGSLPRFEGKGRRFIDKR